MDRVEGQECGARGTEAVSLGHFRGLPDARQRAKTVYLLREIWLLCRLAVLAKAETVVHIARIGCSSGSPRSGIGRRTGVAFNRQLRAAGVPRTPR